VSEDIKVDEIVSAFMAVREEREKLKAEYEARDAEHKAIQEDLKAWLLKTCTEMHADSIKTEAGTVIRKLNERFYTNDWDNFSAFVVENNLVPLLEKRIHQGNFKQYLQEHPDDGLPPGVNVMREYDVIIRKSSSVK
jgi:hypothetical protein